MIEHLLPWPPRELSPNARKHHQAVVKIKKAYRYECCTIARQQEPKVKDGKLHLFITFFPPDRRRRDDDNCIASFKSGRDGLADALGIDDSLFVVHSFLSDRVVKGGQVRVRITEPPAGLVELFD